jgi:hypothetical protein
MQADRANLVTAAAAVFVGVAALIVSTYGVIVQRQQVRAQAWPHLQISTSNVGGFKIHVQNVGVGPAEIRSVAVQIDGRAVKNWSEALVRLGAKTDGGATTPSALSIVTSYLNAGRVVPSGADLPVLTIQDPLPEQARMTDHMDIELCYCSVLDECWTLRNGTSVATPECRRPDIAFDE